MRIKEVEIEVRYDVDCSTISPIKRGFEVFAMVLKDIEFKKPHFYLAAPGTLLGLVGLYIGVYFPHIFSAGGSLYFGPTILMVLFIVVGSFLVLIGVLLHSLSTIFRDLKEA